MESSKTDELDEFIKYNQAFNEFDNFIDNIKKNKYKESKENLKYEGYLINLEDIEKFKDNIKYEVFKLYFKETENNNIIMSKKEEIRKFFDIEKFKKIEKVNNVKISSHEFLINMIMNDNRYILITDELWKVIGAKEEKEDNPPLIFSINNKSQLVLYLDNNKKLYFTIYENFIKKNLLLEKNGEKEIYKKVGNYFQSVVEYDNIEKFFFRDLQNESLSSSEFFLVDEKWINKWRLFTNYHYIKKKYYDKNKNNFIEKDSINNIIYHQEKYKNIYKLSCLNLLKFETIKDIEK